MYSTDCLHASEHLLSCTTIGSHSFDNTRICYCWCRNCKHKFCAFDWLINGSIATFETVYRVCSAIYGLDNTKERFLSTLDFLRQTFSIWITRTQQCFILLDKLFQSPKLFSSRDTENSRVSSALEPVYSCNGFDLHLLRFYLGFDAWNRARFRNEILITWSLWAH